MTHQTDLLEQALEFIEGYEDVTDGSDGPQPNRAMVLAREIRAALSTPQADKVPAAEGASEKQQKLLELADRIDHERLWNRPFMESREWTQDQRDRHMAGVELRRYADLWKSNRWVVFPPVGPVHFSASTLDAAYEMAKRDEERKNTTPPAKLPQEAQPKQNWAPYLSDRADGVRGHFAIARWNTRGYREVWNLRTHQWSAFSDEVLTGVEAEKMLESITFNPQPARAGAVELNDAEIHMLRSMLGFNVLTSPEKAVLSKVIAAATTAATGGKDQFGRTPDMVRFQNMMDAGDEE